MKCIFPEVELNSAALCTFREKLLYALKSCLLILELNGPKDTFFGFVFLRLSYIMIIDFATSLPFIIPKYNRKDKGPEGPHGSSHCKSVAFCFSLSHLRKLVKN